MRYNMNNQAFFDALVHTILNNSDDLLTKDNAQTKPAGNQYWGKCYIVSEAIYYYFGGNLSPYTPHGIRHENTSHWYLVHKSGDIVDYTCLQYETMPDYSLGRGRGFLPVKAGISKRSQHFLSRVKEQMNIDAENNRAGGAQ